MKTRKVTDDGEVIETLVMPLPISAAAPFFKTPYNHDTDHESLTSALVCADPSRTQQQFAKDADINVILAKFRETGELPQTGAPQYLDVGDDEESLQDRMVTSHQVDQAWSKLTPEQRNTLKDPATFVAYVEHCLETGDLTELRKLGLANPLPPQETPEPLKPGAGAPPAPVPNAAPAA